MAENPLELLVRPNQSSDFRPPGNAPRRAQVGDVTKNDNVLVSWGSGGDSIFTVTSPSFGFKLEEDKGEIERTYDVVRIKNKDDPEQYVDTQVMTEWKGRNRIDGSRTTLRFAPPEEDENSEVLEKDKKRHYDFYELYHSGPDNSGEIITGGTGGDGGGDP